MAKNNVNPISDEMLDQILGEAKTQDDLFGSDSIIKNLSKRLMERLLQEEMTEHLGYFVSPQRSHLEYKNLY